MIHAIDPGLANTAIVTWCGRIVAARTFSTKGDGHKTDPVRALERCREITAKVMECVTPGDTIVMESYIDIPGGTYRIAANRWTTPILIGYLCCALDASGCTIILQRPDVVLKIYAAHKQAWGNKLTGLLPGDNVLLHNGDGRKRGNDHERSAAAHLAYYLGRYPK